MDADSRSVSRWRYSLSQHGRELPAAGYTAASAS